MEVLSLIKSIRDSFKGSVVVYTEGGCYKFFEILKSVFPQSKAWYDGIDCHVYTEIEGKFYDIKGEHTKMDHWVEVEKSIRIKEIVIAFHYD